MKNFNNSFRQIPGQTNFIDFNVHGKLDSDHPKDCLQYLGQFSIRMRKVLDALDGDTYCIRSGFNEAAIKLLEFENKLDDIITEYND